MKTVQDIEKIPFEVIEDRREFQKNRVPQIKEEFTLKKIVIEENKMNYNGIVAIAPIDFSAKCEHHLVSIHGKCWFAYIPNKKLIGLSQVARIIEYYLNVTEEIIQEEATKVLADVFEKVLEPQGLWLIIKARHECMSSRGIRQRNALTATAEIRGRFKIPAVRDETKFLWGLQI